MAAAITSMMVVMSMAACDLGIDAQLSITNETNETIWIIYDPDQREGPLVDGERPSEAVQSGTGFVVRWTEVPAGETVIVGSSCVDDNRYFVATAPDVDAVVDVRHLDQNNPWCPNGPWTWSGPGDHE